MSASPWLGRALFAIALVAIPFPYQIVDGGHVPAVWLAVVATLVVTSALGQGGPISAIIAQWFAVQALIAVALAYVAARLATAMVRRLVPPERQRLAVAVIVGGALATASLPIFATTAVRGGAPTNLVGIFALR